MLVAGTFAAIGAAIAAPFFREWTIRHWTLMGIAMIVSLVSFALSFCLQSIAWKNCLRRAGPIHWRVEYRSFRVFGMSMYALTLIGFALVVLMANTAQDWFGMLGLLLFAICFGGNTIHGLIINSHQEVLICERGVIVFTQFWPWETTRLAYTRFPSRVVLHLRLRYWTPKVALHIPEDAAQQFLAKYARDEDRKVG